MAPPDPRLQLTQFPMVSARAARAPSFRARQAASLIVNDGPGVTSARKSILGTLVELVPANALVLCFVSGQPLTADRFGLSRAGYGRSPAFVSTAHPDSRLVSFGSSGN